MIVIISNFVVGIFGGLLFAAALYASLSHDFKGQLRSLVDEETIAQLEDLQSYTRLLTALAVFGGILFLIGFLGCCGASCDSRCMLGMYCIIVLLCAIVELALAIAIFTQQDAIEVETNKIVVEGFKKADATTLHNVEIAFSCCGVDGTTSSEHMTCPLGSKGCAQAVFEVINGGLIAVGVISILAVVVQVTALAFTCCLYSAIGKRQGYMEYA